MTRRQAVLGFLALAAAVTTTDVFDAQTGQRIGTVRETPSGAVDLLRPDGSRAGWGRRNADGSTELFAPDGRRLGIIRPGETTIWLDRPAPGKGTR